MKTNRICVWSGPRNVSTALMYSFAQRADTRVIDEPLYSAYLSGPGAHRAQAHPGAEEVISSLPSDPDVAIREGMLQETGCPVYFIKNMAQHWGCFPEELLPEFANVILFRHPALVARSFDKVVEAPVAADLGFPQQLEILNGLRRMGLPVVSAESERIRNAPEQELRRLCEGVGIDFDPSMLSWDPGGRPEDGIWAKHWYANVHASTGFSPDHAGVPDLEDLPERIRPVVEECLPIYEELRRLAGA